MAITSKVAIAFVALSMFISYGDCLNCYMCQIPDDECDDSFYDGKKVPHECTISTTHFGEPNANSKINWTDVMESVQTKTTSMEKAGTFTCAKVQAQNKEARDLIRGCALPDMTCDHIKKDIASKYPYKYEEIDCSLCTGDGCNGSIKSTLSMAMIISVVILKAIMM